MLLKNSLANQEAVQAKRQQKKSSRASGQEEKKTAVCVSVVFIPPLSRSLSISRLWGAFEWVSVCVYVAEKRGRQRKGVSLGLLLDSILLLLKLGTRKKWEETDSFSLYLKVSWSLQRSERAWEGRTICTKGKEAAVFSCHWHAGILSIEVIFCHWILWISDP